jgi:hypothetical protein
MLDVLWVPSFYLIRIMGCGVHTWSIRHFGHYLAFCTSPGWLWKWNIWRNVDCQGNPKYSEKTYPSSTLSTKNPTWPDTGLNPSRRGGKPATNRLSYSAASNRSYLEFEATPSTERIPGWFTSNITSGLVQLLEIFQTTLTSFRTRCGVESRVVTPVSESHPSIHVHGLL